MYLVAFVFNTALTRVYSTQSKSKIHIQMSGMRHMRSISIQHTDCPVFGLRFTTFPPMRRPSTLIQYFAASCRTNIKRPYAKGLAVLGAFPRT